jgi:hypothetical protein
VGKLLALDRPYTRRFCPDQAMSQVFKFCRQSRRYLHEHDADFAVYVSSIHVFLSARVPLAVAAMGVRVNNTTLRLFSSRQGPQVFLQPNGEGCGPANSTGAIHFQS